MVITDPIRQAIIAAVKHSGSSLSFARSIGVSHTSVLYWIKGRTRKINSTNWNNLLPLIEGYLGDAAKESFIYPTFRPAPPLVFHEPPPASRYGERPRMGTGRNAPLFHFDDLADFDPAFDTVECLAEEKARGLAKFTTFVPPGQFAVEVDEKHAGYFPPKTTVLIGWREVPKDGETVLVKLREKCRFLFARYGRQNGTVTLTPLQKGARKITMSKEAFHSACAWIAPVREAVQVF